jgi:hypothetical protein
MWLEKTPAAVSIKRATGVLHSLSAGRANKEWLGSQTPFHLHDSGY